jgi:hypothetical protein
MGRGKRLRHGNGEQLLIGKPKHEHNMNTNTNKRLNYTILLIERNGRQQEVAFQGTKVEAQEHANLLAFLCTEWGRKVAAVGVAEETV